MISQRLRDLDNRILHMDQREAELRTEAGWRKQARRWRLLAGVAAVLLGVAFLGGIFADGAYAAFSVLGGSLAFQAGLLKAEDDRLNGRGNLNRFRPPGL